jgi:hypothetical protein
MQISEEYLKLGNELFRCGQYCEALKLYKLAGQSNHYYSSAYQHLSISEKDLRELEVSNKARRAVSLKLSGF